MTHYSRLLSRLGVRAASARETQDILHKISGRL